MAFQVDSATYDKHKHFDPRHGYQARGTTPRTVVVHSTSNPNATNTPFTSEATFLFTSADVSAHYLIGKQGQIVCFLDPKPWQAWHAGAALPDYTNPRSIGIELHHSVGDPPYPGAQLNALAWLISDLMGRFAIPRTSIETHGQIAIPGPYKRKKDPHDWPYAGFLAWRALLPIAEGLPTPDVYRVMGLPVYQAESLSGIVAGHVLPGQSIVIDRVYPNGAGHMVDPPLGFLDMDGLEPL